jgi:hypothetical protein
MPCVGRVLACTNLLRSTCETATGYVYYTVLLTLVSAPILSAFKFSGILIESFSGGESARLDN